MTDIYVPQTNGAGTKLHSFSRTVSGQTVHEEAVLPALGAEGSGAAAVGASGGQSFITTVSDPASFAVASGPYGFFFGRLLPPYPYYTYITAVSARQIDAFAAGAADVVRLGVAVISGGYGDGQTTTGAPSYSPGASDTNDPVMGLGGFNAVWHASTVLISMPILLNVPCVASTGFPLGARAEWTAPGKPIRTGPGQATSLGLYQLAVTTTPADIEIQFEYFLRTY